MSPTFLFSMVYLLALAVGWLSGFHTVSLTMHLHVMLLMYVGTMAEFFAGIMIQYRPNISQDRLIFFWPVVVFGTFMFLGTLAIFHIRIVQLETMSSIQALRMALIVGELPSLPFPLSNIQSFSHGFALVLLSHMLFYRSSHRSKWVKVMMILSFFNCVFIGLIEGNRAAFVIICVQIFLMLALRRRLPSSTRLISYATCTLLLFFVLQIYVRQSVAYDEVPDVLNMALKNVGSYVSGGIVAFDMASNLQVPTPPYNLPITGMLATIAGQAGDGDEMLLPFVNLGGEVYGNVYSALFYLGFLETPVLSIGLYFLVTFITAVLFRLANRGPFYLLAAQYCGVTFILWPLSEYWISLLPLMIRVVVVYFYIRILCIFPERFHA